MYGLVSRYGGSCGGRFVLFGLASSSKNRLSAEFRRHDFMGKRKDLSTIKQPLQETFSFIEDEQKP